MISSAMECFKNARAAIEAIALDSDDIEVEYRMMTKTLQTSMTRICVSNSIYLMKLGQLSKSAEEANQLQVKIDDDSHTGFCSISFS